MDSALTFIFAIFGQVKRRILSAMLLGLLSGVLLIRIEDVDLWRETTVRPACRRVVPVW